MSQLKVSTFLSLHGKAKEAISFYQNHLQAQVVFCITNQEITERLDPTYTYPASENDWIAHSVLNIGDSQLMIADELMSDAKQLVLGTNFSLCITSASQEEISTLYNRLIEHPQTRIIIPLAPNLFSTAYAIVEDPYGVVIQLVKEK
ncbi:VOC family protein [Paenibacillus nuruki]|uniref:VOC family protein n=1 Tax=Paenibacillus nuruki TaxID=1886670 RepID=UPI00280478E4|nr:VOC family protein [Paenibacillus nuruki]CAJ1316373.1 3-dmu-9-3-mt domain-containing protein [Paenibacillus nuruki]